MFDSTSVFLLVLATSIGSLVLLLCVTQFRDGKRKARSYPPGPFSIPFFGPLKWSMLSVFRLYRIFIRDDYWLVDCLYEGDDRYKSFVKWSMHYGSDIISFSLTPIKRIVVLNSYRVMRDALQGATSDIFAGRPVNFGKITQPAADNIGECHCWLESVIVQVITRHNITLTTLCSLHFNISHLRNTTLLICMGHS